MRTDKLPTQPEGPKCPVQPPLPRPAVEDVVWALSL